jgi:hypothetical protein
MTLKQATFLGASIRNFSATVGWGEQSSVLNVGLVEDSTNGDKFRPPEVGHPVYFKYSNWKFGGLLQSSITTRGDEGNPLYEVQIVDPRELLSGVQLILNNYTGSTFGVPNLYNIYGYLENKYGFGGSGQNGSGIPWRLIRDAFYELQLSTPINFRGYNYILLPIGGAVSFLPEHYRIGGEIISALDYINELTTAVACDYFVDLWDGYIFVYLVDRSKPSVTNSINNFISSVDGATSKEQGYELVNGITSKFCIGGPQATLHTQQDNIIPYWGNDPFGNLILGRGNFESLDGSEYQVTLNGLSLYICTGIPRLINYDTDLAELRHALIGQTHWEQFLWSKNDIENSIHRGKANILKLSDRMAIKQFLNNNPIRPGAMPDIGAENIRNAHISKINRDLDVVYQFVRNYATDFYGKKFLVPIPYTLAKMDDQTNRVVLSQKPIDSGFFDETNWPIAMQNGWMPYNPEKFTTFDNRLTCYTGFTGVTDIKDFDDTIAKTKYGLDYLNPDDYILDQYPNMSTGKIRENLFVRANVDERIVFFNNVTLFRPHVIITLAEKIVDNVGSPTSLSAAGVSMLKQYLVDRGVPENERQIIDNNIERAHRAFGGDYFNFGKFARCYIPKRAIIPLESHILRYGPWYASRKPGRVEVEIDSTLVPWEYGGFELMNLAGNARVATALFDHQINEKGSITFPGIPNVQLGQALLDGGPAITDIQVNIAEEGVTTTYRINTWSYEFGKVGKHNVDRMKKMSILAVEQRKNLRKLFGYNKPLEEGQRQFMSLRESVPRRHSAGSSHTFLCAEVFVGGSGNNLSVNIGAASLAGYNLIGQINPDYYKDQAIMSMDGMFIPYTTNYNNSNHLPKFELPSDDAEEPTANNLNPFGGDSIITASVDQDDIPSDIINNGYNFPNLSKGVGLRSPIVVGGWGYDIDGNPVPSGESGHFLDNYKQRADKWKVGPLDIRWDNERKVWTSIGGSTSRTIAIKPLRLIENLLSGHSALAVPMTQIENTFGVFGGWTAVSGAITVYDFLLYPGTQHFAGDKIMAAQIELDTVSTDGMLPSNRTTSIWVVLNGQCGCV